MHQLVALLHPPLLARPGRGALEADNAVRRLEKSPQGRRELALAHAYLAWTYHGLNRTGEAQAAAAAAIRVDPGIGSSLGGFPAPVSGLFNRAREY